MDFKSRLRAFGTFAIRAGGKARTIRPHIIFASSTPLTIIVPALVARFLRATPVVFEVRDLWPEVPIAMGVIKRKTAQQLAYVLQRLAYTRSQHIIALSPDMKKGIVAKGVPERNITVIPNSADVERFQGVAEDASAEFRKAYR